MNGPSGARWYGVIALAVGVGCGRIDFTALPADDAAGDAIACGTVPVTAVAAGRAFTCALRENGSIACWGSNVTGQLGFAGAKHSVEPVDVVLPASAKAIAAGAYHACAVLVDGRVYCWGNNGSGELGDLTTTSRTSPVQAAVPAADEIVAGARHTCARIAANGSVYCWGQNARNQGGDGGATNNATPTPVMGLSNVHGLVAGHSHTCAITSTNGATCWGMNVVGQLGAGNTNASAVPVTVNGLSDVAELAAGARFTCARRRSDGIVGCWGGNDDGQLGTGDYALRTSMTNISALSGVTSLAGGTRHMCAASAAGVRCVGRGDQGQLGDGTLESRPSYGPAVVGASATGKLSSGYAHGCAVEAGRVRCWGSNSDGQLGIGTRTLSTRPVVVASLTAMVEVTASNNFACAHNTTASCWGSLPLTDSSIVPVASPFASVTQLESGYSHTCVRDAAGAVVCAGTNFAGQLGNGSNTASLPPVSPGLTNVSSVAAAVFSSCAVDNGSVKCWGYNSVGQLGDGTQTDRNAPIDAGGFTNAVQVSTGGFSTCALLSTGAVHCWGENRTGQLGDNTVGNSRPTPGPVTSTGFGAAMSVDVGVGGHACVVAINKTVWCWGYNGWGQLGNNAGDVSRVPVRVEGLTAESVSVGSGHTCALDASAAVWCWGNNDTGQLGDGTTDDRFAPVRVAELPTALTVSASAGYTCAVLTDGTVRCWGVATAGQLGDGTPLPGAVSQPSTVYCRP